MTKQPSIKPPSVDHYDDLDLHQLETILDQFLKTPPSPTIKQQIRTVRQAIRTRQRIIKAKVMEFEQTNSHHLLIFDSTENFSKIAGRSVLFYTLTIADRIHRRYCVKNDTDDYSRSLDGVVSIRALKPLEAQLAEINILPDRERSTSELHFYTLPKFYRDEQIDRLRDRSRQDVERITSIILPQSPVPELYQLLLEMNRLVFYSCRRICDRLARTTLIQQIVLDANETLISYLNFANAKPSSGIVRRQTQTSVYPTQGADQADLSTQAQNLLNIMLNTRNIRNCMANLDNLRLIHHRELCLILEILVEIERVTAREYAKQLRHDRSHPPKPSHT